MIGLLKQLAPYLFYALGGFVFLLALSGQVRWALLFIIPLFPLRNVVEKLHAFPFGKDFMDILMLGMLLGWIFNTMSKGKKFFADSPLNGICFLYVGYLLFSYFRGFGTLGYFAIDIGDPRLEFWKTVSTLPLLYFFTLNSITDRKWVYRTILVMCLTMVLMNYYTVQQIADFSELVSRGKMTGTFVYLGPNEVAAFYNQYTIFLMTIFFAIKNKVQKSLLFWLILINLNCILLLFSRGAYAGLVVGIFCVSLFRKPILLLPLIMVLLSWQVVLPDKVIQRIEMTTNEYGELEESAQSRIIIWEQSLNLFKSTPIFGIGLNVFKSMGYDLGDTHNVYLKILTEQGILGLGIFFMLVFNFILQGWRLYKKGDDDLSRSIGLGFVFLVLVLLVNNVFGERWSHVQVSAFLWVIAGLVARLNILVQEKETEVQMVSSAVKTKRGFSNTFKRKGPLRG